MKIVSWNVNGLRAIMNKGFFDFFSKTNYDILCLQETKLQSEQIPPEIKNASIHQYWNFAEKKGYSGVAIFTKEKPLSITNGIDNNTYNHEGRTIIAEYDNFYLINCYFPNGQMNNERLQFKLGFYESMFSTLERLRKSGKGIIVLGDFNTAHKEIDLKNPKENENTSGFLPIERAWLDKLMNNGWVDTFREFDKSPEQYTWWTYRFGARKRNIGWRIDYVFINNEIRKHLKNAFIWQNIQGSDHCPLGIDIF
ncbi:MAG: exodeoxyribonuclease III [Candidatus Cloacimonetes bacterium]|nr:exodeoxyribonuclease III [Candidatus Cloacimonadota bacterium]